jgi:hypothetical protein
MDYTDYSDCDIVFFVHNIRKISLLKDLRRHKICILLIRIGLKKGYSKHDIPWLSEWASRLKKIIDNGYTYHT